MYSIADLNNKRLTLIRDKFGIKPLYYQDSNDSFYFCSEALPLLDTTFGCKTLNAEAFDEYLLLGQTVTPGNTIFNEIKSLAPEHSLVKGKGELIQPQLNIFPQYQFDLNIPTTDLHKKLRNMIHQAVKQCTLSNRQIGLALSGGVDSSILAWELNSLGIENVTTISLICEGASDGIKNLNELALPAGGAWEKWCHVTVPFDESDFKEYLLQAIKSSAIPLALTSYPLYF